MDARKNQQYFQEKMHTGMMYGGCTVYNFNANLYFHVLLLFKH